MRCAYCCLWLLLALQTGLPARAGLLTEGTRVIYPQEHPQSLTISNTNPWPVLVQTWVDQGEGEFDSAKAPFVVVPSIFRLESLASQSLRIFHTGDALPEGRESLYWLNLYEIPPEATDAGEARLTLTINTQLKLLYRPQGVGAPDPDTLAAQLEFHLEQQDGRWCIHGHNPTPWHASLSALFMDGPQGPLPVDEVDLLLPPFSERYYRLPPTEPAAQAQVYFGLIDDGGFSQMFP